MLSSSKESGDITISRRFKYQESIVQYLTFFFFFLQSPKNMMLGKHPRTSSLHITETKVKALRTA